MRLKLLFTVIIAYLLLPLSLWADHISERQALEKAQAFAAGKGMDAITALGQPSKMRRAKMATTENDSYYVFNIGQDKGFVIVSGDDRTADILGYADCGSISDDNMPDGLRYLLDGYREQIENLSPDDEGDNHAADSRALLSSTARTPIAPLIQSRWNQGAPYNLCCPEINGEKTVTGCVATAMAQVMYYYKYPTNACTNIPGYTTKTTDKDKNSITLNLDNLPAKTFNWSDMTNTYNNSSSEEARTAVAELMQYCGWSLRMGYGLNSNGGSIAYNVCIAEALKSYFDYDCSIHYVKRNCYSYAEWVNLFYSELVSGRPVILGGQSAGGGHSFVCDGFDTDDLFHINWGWGGKSDGYFRLSALNPAEQGMGGSSTLDGFSYSQDAIIGIQPNTGSGSGYCLSLEGFSFGESDYNTSKEFTRTTTDDSFTGISLYLVLCRYNYDISNYDYAVQLVNANGNEVHTLHTVKNIEFTHNKDQNPTLNFSIPSGVANGTYYIKVVSRPANTDSWQECYNGDRYQMTAVINGNSLTITVPIPATSMPTGPESGETITIGGNSDNEGYLTVGYEQQVIATVKGGATDYHGNLFLSVNNKAVMGKNVDIPAGQTVDVYFAYTPSTSGTDTLSILNSKGKLIGSSEVVTIKESDATDTQTLTIVPNITNLVGVNLYGNAMRVTATVTNPSTDNTYAGKLNCSLREYANLNDEANNYLDATVITKSIVIDKNSNLEVAFAYDGLDPAKYYRLRFSYLQGYEENGKKKTRTADGPVTDCYAMGKGIAFYAADGTVSIYSETASVDGDNAANAVFVDLRNIDIDNIPLSSNPNCIYLLPDAPASARALTAPAGLEGKNIVQNGVADNLTLEDGHDFYTPVAFTATNVSYTRTFTVAAAGDKGWNTIMLPFTVSTITVRSVVDGSPVDNPVDWFHSATDTGKNFWLRAFYGDGDNTVDFDYASTMTAYTPYIIAVPGSNFGSKQITEKAVTFSGTNAYISATEGSATGNHYKYCGTTVSKNLTDVYVMNKTGGGFVKTSSYTVKPFRTWFSPVSISSLSSPALAISGPETTGIVQIDNQPLVSVSSAFGSWYTLSGAKLPKAPTTKGAYIFRPYDGTVNSRIHIIR